MAASPQIPPLVRRFIEHAGNVSQSFGLGRVVGQIYAYLYFSNEPRSLADLELVLGISKGSASMGVRQLEQWNAVRKIWVRGDRKDYYEANDWLGRILRNAVVDTMGQRLSAYTAFLEELRADTSLIEEHNGDGDVKFIRERVNNLLSFQQKAEKVRSSPLVQLLLK